MLGTQAVGIVAALLLAATSGEPVPQGADLAWAVAAGLAGVVGISCLYRGLAEGRMGVVAPTTGVIGAVIPVLIGFVLEGVPSREVVIGIAVALVAVVLVTRAPTHDPDRPSGLEWALASGLAIGVFNVCIGQLSPAGAFGPLAVLRLVQVIVLCGLIVAWRQPWRMDGWTARRLVPIGLLDVTGNVAFIMAAQAGQLAIAAVLSSLYPVTTVLLAIAVLHERMTRSHVVGVALTVVAIVLIGAGSAG